MSGWDSLSTLRNRQTADNQQRTTSTHQRNRFVEHEVPRDHGNQRKQIDVDDRDAITQDHDRMVPDQIATGGSDHGQIQDVQHDRNRSEVGQRYGKACEREARQQTEYPVEENPTGAIEKWQTQMVDPEQQHGIRRPADSRRQREQISRRREFQHHVPVEYDQRDTTDGKYKSNKEIFSQTGIAEQSSQQSGEQRGGGHDDRHIRGKRHGNGIGLKHIVGGDSDQPGQSEQPFPLPRETIPMEMRMQAQQDQIADAKSNKQEFYRFQHPEQILGGDQRSPPDQHGGQGAKMGYGGSSFHNPRE